MKKNLYFYIVTYEQSMNTGTLQQLNGGRVTGLESQEATCEVSCSGMDFPFYSRDHVLV